MALAKPTNFRVDDQGAVVVIKWSPVDGAVGYEYMYGENGEAEIAVVADGQPMIALRPTVNLAKIEVRAVKVGSDETEYSEWADLSGGILQKMGPYKGAIEGERSALDRRVVEETNYIGQALEVLSSAGIIHAEAVNYRATQPNEIQTLDEASKRARTKEAAEVRGDLLIALGTNLARKPDEFTKVEPAKLREEVATVPWDEETEFFAKVYAHTEKMAEKLGAKDVRIGDLVLAKVQEAWVEEYDEIKESHPKIKGNRPILGSELPMVVTRVEGNIVNGIVFFDGNVTKWVTSTTSWRHPS